MLILMLHQTIKPTKMQVHVIIAALLPTGFFFLVDHSLCSSIACQLYPYFNVTVLPFH